MAKEKLHNLKNTPTSFQLRGIVTNTKGKRFYQSGTSKSGGQWNATEFGVKIADNKTVFVSLRGFPRAEVFYYKRGENGAKGTTQKVAWKDRHKAPGKDFRLIGVNISTGKDENNKNVNETFVEFDAVEWIHDNLKDGDSVFIKGNLSFTSYTGRDGQVNKRIEMVPTQISYTQKPVDFDAEDYTEMCEFENTLVFQSIDKEEDENGKASGRFILTGYNIGYNTVESASFIIDEEHAKLANNLRKAMKPGYAIKTFGRLNVVNNISVVQDDDDGWGESSPMERVNAPVRREYIVYRADPSSIEKEDYSEDAIMEALRKIKAAKTAEQNFGSKTKNIDVEVEDDWSTDDDDSWDMDDSNPWG